MDNRLEIRIGPMFSGKTTALITQLLQAIHDGKRALAIKPALDNRYSIGAIVAHGSPPKEFSCILANTSAEIEEIMVSYKPEFVCVDEFQFFREPNSLEICRRQTTTGINLVVAGLDRDYQGRPFEWIASIQPEDKVRPHFASCEVCGEPAQFTERFTTDSKARIQIGGHDLYRPVCGPCHPEIGKKQ